MNRTRAAALISAVTLVVSVVQTGPASAAIRTLKVNDASVTETDSITKAITFTIRLSSAKPSQVTVRYATANGTAKAPADYKAKSGSVTFLPGQVAKKVTVTTKGDPLDEDNETLRLKLSDPTGATIGDGSGRGTIIDNDAAPSLAAADAQGGEGGVATFSVSLSAPSGKSITVAYSTASATAGQADFTAAEGTLNFTPGATIRTVPVALSSDTLAEPDETFRLMLGTATNAVVSDPSATGTITDMTGVPQLSIADNSGDEGGTVDLVATLSHGSDSVVTVGYAASFGTAAAGDLGSSSGTLTFQPGDRQEVISIAVVNDTMDEHAESFFITLSAPTNAVLADATGQGTIVDNDDPPALSVNDVSLMEGNSNTSNANFTVSLSQLSGKTVQVAFVTSSSSALEGSDYQGVDTIVSILPGTPSAVVTVPIAGDTTLERAELFNVDLSDPVDATIADGHGNGTLINDDSCAGRSFASAFFLGSLAGDTGADFLNTQSRACQGGGSDHIRVTVSEESSNDVYLSVAIQLLPSASPYSGTGNIDLHVYRTDGSLIASSTNGGITAEVVKVRRDDDPFGSDDSFDLIIEARATNGANDYTLTVNGHVAVDSANY